MKNFLSESSLLWPYRDKLPQCNSRQQKVATGKHTVVQSWFQFLSLVAFRLHLIQLLPCFGLGKLLAADNWSFFCLSSFTVCRGGSIVVLFLKSASRTSRSLQREKWLKVGGQAHNHVSHLLHTRRWGRAMVHRIDASDLRPHEV